MAKLKTVGVREFRDHAMTSLSGSGPVAVSKHGRVVGFSIPLARDEDEVRRALTRLGETVDQVLDETDLSEEELISRGLYEHMEAVARRRATRGPHDWSPVALSLVPDARILTG